MPQLQTSDNLGSYARLASSTSGAVYAVDPQYVSLTLCLSICRANPKSATFKLPSIQIKRFSHLISLSIWL